MTSGILFPPLAKFITFFLPFASLLGSRRAMKESPTIKVVRVFEEVLGCEIGEMLGADVLGWEIVQMLGAEGVDKGRESAINFRKEMEYLT